MNYRSLAGKNNIGCLITVLVIVALVVTLLSFSKSWLLAGLTVNLPIVRSEAIVMVGGAFKECAPAVASLYHQGYAPLVVLNNDGVFSVWSKKYNLNLYQVEWAEEELIKLGVPPKRIVKLPFYGSSTMFDALAAKQYLCKTNLKKIIIVASDYHTRRTTWTFSHVLKTNIGHITVFPVKSFRIGIWGLVMEYIKFGYYLIRYDLLRFMPEMNEVPLKRPLIVQTV